MKNLYEAPSSKLVYFLADDVLVNSSDFNDDNIDDPFGGMGDIEMP